MLKRGCLLLHNTTGVKVKEGIRLMNEHLNVPTCNNWKDQADARIAITHRHIEGKFTMNIDICRIVQKCYFNSSKI